MIREAFIDRGKRRPGTKITPRYLTIHSTGNPDSTARNERDFLNSSYNTSSTSWHVCVDEKEAVMAIPLSEMAHHAGGDGRGNRESVSLEICESGNRILTLENAIETAAEMLRMLGLTERDMVCHRDWNGKNCPRILLNEGLWRWFRTRVGEKLRHKEVDPLDIEIAGGCYPGFLLEGTAYGPVRPMGEALGHHVHYGDGKVVVR